MFKFLEKQAPKPFLILVGIDFLLLILSFYLGVAISWVEFEFDYDTFSVHIFHAVAFAVVLTTANFALGLYDADPNASLSGILIRLCVSFVFSFVAFSGIFYLFPEFLIWRAVMAGAMVSGWFAVATAHFVLLRVADVKALKRRVLVVGTDRRAAQIEALENRGRAYGFAVAGYLELPGETAMVAKTRVIPRTASLVDMVKLGGVEEIVVAAQDRRGRLPVDDLVECGFRGVTITDFLTFWERETKQTNLEALHQDWVLFSSRFPGGRVHNLLSRSFDVTVSLVVLVIFFPLILATAIAVKLESPGPVFYRQERVGRGGVAFKLIKFRSMRADAEEDGVPQWAAQNDPRVTMVGTFIRMVRIDEIPQVFNVLLGDMKFVGPRPERSYFVEQLAREIPFYRERFRVKPGITGWAQLNYPYGASIADAREKLQYDLYYLRHYSLLLDFIIVLQTVKVIIWPLRRGEALAHPNSTPDSR